MHCRRLAINPYPAPSEPQLPKFRLEQAKPFKKLWCRLFWTHESKIRSRHSQSLGLFVTCLVTRAIHLELVEDATTAEFLEAYKRFASRRGPPSIMLSDHGTQFEAGARILQEILIPKSSLVSLLLRIFSGFLSLLKLHGVGVCTNVLLVWLNAQFAQLLANTFYHIIS